jgi:hypothetical protein
MAFGDYHGNREPMKCVAGIWNSHSQHQCRSKKVIGDYCRLHDPAAIEAKKAKRRAEWDGKWAAKEAAWAAPGKRIKELEAQVIALQAEVSALGHYKFMYESVSK